MKNKKHTPLLAALATLVVLLAGVVLIWLAKTCNHGRLPQGNRI